MPLFNARYSPYRYIGGGQIVGSDGDQVAYLAGRMNDGNADVAGNAMAAAPELYRALYAILDAHDGHSGRRFEREAAAGRAALAKARGEVTS